MAAQDIKMTVSAGEPFVEVVELEPSVEVVAGPAVPPATTVGDVSGGGVVIDHPPSSEDEREEGFAAVLVEQEDDDFSYWEWDFSDEDEEDNDTDDEDVDSDSEFEEDGHVAPAGAPAVTSVANFMFLGQPTRLASVVSTIGFMRLAPTEAAPAHDGGGEILVDYRYTRFLRPQSGGPGVEMHVLGPKLACVRFHLPSGAASDPASSLYLAGASLASLAIYPARFNVHLRDLWSGMIIAAPVCVPPRTTRIKVTVDVGILRPEDFTAERMRRMRAALESVACTRDAKPGIFDDSMELHLPGPLSVEDEVRPTKRRRVTGDDCPICWEALERGLAAWPRCSHIFHGRCLEEHLLRGYQECPMCRSDLKVNNAPSRE